MPLLDQILSIACFALWTVSYVLILRQARADGRVGMPLIPLCMNVCYEFIFGFVYPDVPPVNYSNQLWFFVDLLLFAQFLKYGRREFTDLVSPRLFVPTVLATLVLCGGGILAVTAEFNDYHGGNYTGWGDQILICVSFVALITRRRSSKGQSMYIGLARMIGTLCLVPVQYHLMPHSKLLAFIYVVFPMIDALYLTLLYRQCRREGRDPWSLAVTREPENTASVAEARLAA